MKLAVKQQKNGSLEVYQLIADKCYRMNLLKDPLSKEELAKQELEDLDNFIANGITPGINKLLDKGLFNLYQALYTIDVSEEEIKEKILDLENTTMIPSIIAFAIIDRLKERYQHYPSLHQSSA